MAGVLRKSVTKPAKATEDGASRHAPAGTASPTPRLASTQGRSNKKRARVTGEAEAKRDDPALEHAQHAERDCEQLDDLCHALELRAEAAERTLQELISTISHDVRNPLSVILVSSRMLLRSLGADASGRRQLDAIVRAADEINQMVQDVVDALRIEDGSLRIGREPHDVASIVDKAIEFIGPVASMKPLELVKEELPGDLPPIAVDRERLVQVLAGVINNAVRFTPKGGKVTVGVEPWRGDVRFFVRDTGPGIPAEQRPSLFRRHVAGKRPLGQGMGLALFVAKGIIEAHGGSIWVESEPGAGATFFFTIPTEARAAEAAPTSVRAAQL